MTHTSSTSVCRKCECAITKYFMVCRRHKKKRTLKQNGDPRLPEESQYVSPCRSRSHSRCWLNFRHQKYRGSGGRRTTCYLTDSRWMRRKNVAGFPQIVNRQCYPKNSTPILTPSQPRWGKRVVSRATKL
jgi:hypothetical protein